MSHLFVPEASVAALIVRAAVVYGFLLVALRVAVPRAGADDELRPHPPPRDLERGPELDERGRHHRAREEAQEAAGEGGRGAGHGRARIHAPQARQVIDPDFLDLEEVLDIHDRQLAKFGGAAGRRDQNLLESALAMPRATFGGEFVHEDLCAMAAAYAFHIAQNQPFEVRL